MLMHKDANLTAVIRSKINLGSSIKHLVDLASPMLYTNIQLQSFLGSGEKDF